MPIISICSLRQKLRSAICLILSLKPLVLCVPIIHVVWVSVGSSVCMLSRGLAFPWFVFRGCGALFVVTVFPLSFTGFFLSGVFSLIIVGLGGGGNCCIGWCLFGFG